MELFLVRSLLHFKWVSVIFSELQNEFDTHFPPLPKPLSAALKSPIYQIVQIDEIYETLLEIVSKGIAVNLDGIILIICYMSHIPDERKK